MPEQSTKLVVRSTAKSGGLISALWILAKSTPRVAIEPTARAVRYSDERRRGIAPLCDIYRPQNIQTDLAPSVLLIHGGAFMVGSRTMKPIRYVAARLAQAGIGVCAIDYRLLFRGGRIAQAVADVGAAAEYWREHASDYGCGPKISLMGLSAGATLMLMHASEVKHRYASLVNTYGATDFSCVRGSRAQLVMRLVHKSRDREVWKARSPMFSRAIESPILNLHGIQDQMVPVEHSIRFHESRTEQGLPSELELYDSAPHGWLCDSTRPESELSLKRATEFVLSHSRLRGS